MTPVPAPTTNVASLDSKRAERDYEQIQLYEEMLGEQPKKGSPEEGTITLTAEGLEYYGRWFKRFGYKLTTDSDEFFHTVRAIIRSGYENEVGPNGELFSPDAMAAMPPAARAVAESINTSIATGQADDELAAKTAAAASEQRARTDVVMPITPRAKG